MLSLLEKGCDMRENSALAQKAQRKATSSQKVPLTIMVAMLLTSATLHARPSLADQIDVASLPLVGRVDGRFQSYNIEMAQVTGGQFWKPYRPEFTGAIKVPETSPFEYRAPIDLSNPRLRKLSQALGPFYLRVSGTWANTVYFPDEQNDYVSSPPPGFKSVLHRSQWRGVIEFARAIDAKIVTSFAIGDGVRDKSGVWTTDQAERWAKYTHSLGGKIAAAEFMNEPSMAGIGGAPAGYTAADYGRDFRIFDKFARLNLPEMKILGPGSASETPTSWGMPHVPGSLPTASLLATMGDGIDAFSYHHYGAASMRCAAMKMPQTSAADALSEEWLSRTSLTRAFYEELRDRYEGGKPLWMTEGADAACGGNPWGGTFLDSFRYLDQLGRLAKEGVHVSIHNTLAAGSYGLLNQDDLTPKANYWSALLWHRLMGPTVLDAGNPLTSGIHLYAHCLPNRAGGVTMLAINNGASAKQIRISKQSLRYTLSSPGPKSNSVKLNGRLLRLGANDTLPDLSGSAQLAGDVTLLPETITFLAIPGAGNAACNEISANPTLH